MVSPHGRGLLRAKKNGVGAKKNGKRRRTVDFQPLNKHAFRENHRIQSPFHHARRIPNGKRKTVLDAWNDYHSVPLNEDDRHKTTFNTPQGRYRYIPTPQWYIASADGYRQDQVRGRHATLVRHDRGELLPGGPIAGYNVVGMQSSSTQGNSSSAHPQWTLQASRSPSLRSCSRCT